MVYAVKKRDPFTEMLEDDILWGLALGEPMNFSSSEEEEEELHYDPDFEEMLDNMTEDEYYEYMADEYPIYGEHH